MSEKKQYTWEYSGNNDIWQHDTFDTVEECVQDYLNNYAKDAPQESIFVGVVEPYEISVYSSDIIERLEEQAYDECGEYAENWQPLTIKDNEGWKELDNQIKRLIVDFLKKHNEMPKFYSIIDIREVAIR